MRHNSAIALAQAHWSPGVPTFGASEKQVSLCKFPFGNTETSGVIHRLKGLQIVSCCSRMAYSIGIALPLQLSISGPRIDAQVVSFIGD